MYIYIKNEINQSKVLELHEINSFSSNVSALEFL